jgi:peptidyl-prolyl cis-trans isomerase D
MGILERMRSGSDSTFMQVVIAGVVIAFVFSLANPQADMSSTVAMVNGQAILDTEYGRAYRNELRRVEGEARRTLSDAEQKQLGERVKQQLIEDAVIEQEAERLGLTVSGEEIAMAKLAIDFLRTEDGGFDEAGYQRFLKQQQFTNDAFEAMLREDLLRQKLRFLAFMGASLSEPSLKEAWMEQETRVDIQFIRVRPAAFAADVVIDDAARAEWLVANAEAVKQAYESDFERLYNHPEQVELSMIRLAVQPDGPGVADLLPIVNGLREQLEAGADFATLAKQYSEDPTALAGGAQGKRPVPQLSAETAAAIAGLEVGALTRAVTTEADIRLYRVDGREPPRVDAFEDVQKAIADELIRQERTPALAAAFAEQQLLPRWKESGVLPQDLLDAKGLLAQSTGPIPPMAQGNPFGPPEAILAASRTAAKGTVFPEVYEQMGTLYVAQLVDRLDPDPTAFEAAKGDLKEQVLGVRRSEFYGQWVDETKAAAKIQ